MGVHFISLGFLVQPSKARGSNKKCVYEITLRNSHIAHSIFTAKPRRLSGVRK